MELRELRSLGLLAGGSHALVKRHDLVLAGCLSLLTIGCSAHSAASRGGDPAASDTVRILAYNIHHGEGMDGKLDLERIAALVRRVDPDLVTLQEVDSVTTRTDAVDQASELGRLTGLESIFGRFMSYQGGAYGMAVLSRWPIVAVANHRLPDGAEPRSALSAVVRSPTTGRPPEDRRNPLLPHG